MEFAWRDVFVPPRCAGLVEHARGMRQWGWWGVRTFAGVWRPRRFWERVRLEHRTRVWRGVMWFVCAFAGLYSSIALGFAVLRAIWAWTRLRGAFLEMLGSECASADTWLWWMPYSSGWLEPTLSWVRNFEFRMAAGKYPWWALPFLVMLLVSPLMLVVLPWTRSRAKVELAHVGRWLVYGQSAWLVFLCWLVIAYAAGWVLYKFAPGFGSYANTAPEPWWASAIDVVGWPFSSTVIVPLLLMGWLCRWNWCALKHGMRFEEAKVLWWAVMVPTVLVGAIVVMGQAVVLGIFPPWWV